MKILVRANQVLIQTDITEEDYKKYAPMEVFDLVDEGGDHVYFLDFDPNACTIIKDYGVRCNTVYQGKLAVSFTTNLEEEDMDLFLEDLKVPVAHLRQAQEEFKANIADVQQFVDGIDEMIERE